MVGVLVARPVTRHCLGAYRAPLGASGLLALPLLAPAQKGGWLTVWPIWFRCWGATSRYVCGGNWLCSKGLCSKGRCSYMGTTSLCRINLTIMLKVCSDMFVRASRMSIPPLIGLVRSYGHNITVLHKPGYTGFLGSGGFKSYIKKWVYIFWYFKLYAKKFTIYKLPVYSIHYSIYASVIFTRPKIRSTKTTRYRHING